MIQNNASKAPEGGSGVTLYFSSEFLCKNQKPTQINDPCYIPEIPSGKDEFGAPNCPNRALRYYFRFVKENLKLRMGRHLLFNPS